MKTNSRSNPLRASLAIFTLILSTCICFMPIFIFGLLKLIPSQRWRLYCGQRIDGFVMYWCDLNNAYISHLIPHEWEATGLKELDRQQSYLLIANHQSWLDIVLMHRLFNRRIPVIKFFIKDQLKWVPLLGFAWWAMGCPFMKRYSKAYLAKNPHKQGKDLEATRKAIYSFKGQPVTIANFVEGTRFNLSKKALQGSEYRHLLRPRAGGVSFVIGSMGSQIHKLLDLTIVYAEEKHSLWDFLCGRISKIRVHLREIEIPEQFISNDLTKSSLQDEFKTWINQQWHIKDQLIENIKTQWATEDAAAAHVQAVRINPDRNVNTSQRIGGSPPDN
ncbi:acyltransferase [Legionella sp. 16cNR16C]|uniref:acyltransferase n=1 Tax=Legionella sp. 16cNR16C TaxID=2905656 RepID=UPI001E58D0E2|nr:acyltransferase [Legionella sp. 16cNR16C]MCE3044925.1 acyltransferase [Legionella sp. 16cNR16C]